ncbi:hypothetical protein L9F63_023503, partial [Diploptera punctata]
AKLITMYYRSAAQTILKISMLHANMDPLPLHFSATSGYGYSPNKMATRLMCK